MEQLIIQVLSNVLIVIVTVGAGYAVALLRKRVGVEGINKIQAELSAKQDLVEMAVRMVQQVYKDYNGEQKYIAAADYIAARASEKGLHITGEEIKGLVESTLHAFKDEFVQDLKK